MTDSTKMKLTPQTSDEDVAKIITAMDEEGKTRAVIEGRIMYEAAKSVNETKKLVQDTLGRSGRDSVSLEKVVRYIRDNYGKLSKQELIEGMCEVTGGKFSSMNHMYNYIRLAQEYARQEVEDNQE